MISPVVRGPHGERRYKVSDLEWIAFLKRLRATGMPVREMARFAELRRGGKTTLAERGQLLDEHADRIRRRISELRADLRAIDVKRAVLESRDVLEGR